MNDYEQSPMLPTATDVCKHTLVRTIYDEDLKATGHPESIYLWGRQCFPNDSEQQRAFQILVAKFVLTFCVDADQNYTTSNYCSPVIERQYNNFKQTLCQMMGKSFKDKQLIMLLSGPKKSGKTRVIQELLNYAKQYCSNINQPFTKNTILITACTGLTAASIGGETLCSAIHYHKPIDCISAEEFLSFEKEVRMMVVDDFNMFSNYDIRRVDRHIQMLQNNCEDPFGCLDMIFVGDFCQLPPVGKTTVYNTDYARFLYCINVFIELQNIYGNQQDTQLSRICSHFYNGCPTEEDFIAINKRVISATNPLPSDIKTICISDHQKELDNYDNWLMYLRNHKENEGIVIIADNFQLLENEGIHPRPSATNFFSPRLYCYPRCPQLLTTNIDVNKHLTSGTKGYFIDVVLKPQSDFVYQVVNGIRVRCAHASQIHSVLWETSGNIIKIEPQQCLLPTHDESALFPTKQVPLMSNHATTLNQIQDLSSDRLYVPTWKYGRHWPYVLLSRVSKLTNVFLGEPLDPFANYSLSKRLTTMIRRLRLRAAPGTFSPDDFSRQASDYEVVD